MLFMHAHTYHVCSIILKKIHRYSIIRSLFSFERVKRTPNTPASKLACCRKSSSVSPSPSFSPPSLHVQDSRRLFMFLYSKHLQTSILPRAAGSCAIFISAMNWDLPKPSLRLLLLTGSSLGKVWGFICSCQICENVSPWAPTHR